MQDDDHQKIDVEHQVKIIYFRVAEVLELRSPGQHNQSKDRVQAEADQPKGKEHQEKQEKLVVLVPNTVVHEGAVMVKLLNASAAEVTVERGLRLQVFAVDANVIQVIVFIDNTL